MGQPGFADVSVIIPAYRAARTIGRALASVAAQSLKPMEAVLVDDGSDDGTAEIAIGLAAEMNGVRLKVIQQNNMGPGAARNRALDEARCSWAAFLDADDEWMPEKLDRSMALLAETGADLISHNLEICRDGDVGIIDCARHFQASTNPLVSYFLRGYIATSTVVARRDLLTRVGGFDAGLRSGQDYELWLRIIEQPDIRHHVFAQILTRNHVMDNSISSHISLRRRSAMTILCRHAKIFSQLPAGGIFVSWLRACIIHAQAAAGHMSAGQYGKALWDCLLLPEGLARVILAQAGTGERKK